MNAIAAVSAAWGIGRDGDLLFHISGDLKRFRSLTSGGTVIMGRRTLDSFPGGRPLPKRRNIVLTRNPAFSREGCETARSLEEVLSLVEGEDPEAVWVCGGGEIYRMLLPFCRMCRITQVRAAPPCDAFFPNLDLLDQWKRLEAGEVLSEGGLDYQFVDYENRAPFRKAGGPCRT